MEFIDYIRDTFEKHGLSLQESSNDRFKRGGICFSVNGYKPNYDIREDYGNQYSHDLYSLSDEILTAQLGVPAQIHTPLMDETHDAYWGTSYKIWQYQKHEAEIFMYGHPKSGFFNMFVYCRT
jgi:hypothetical protein